MKIQSKFRDYYDFVAHKYGGEPGFVYARHRLTPLENLGHLTLGGGSTIKADLQDLPFTSTYGNWVCKWLVICGKYYLVVGKFSKDGLGFPEIKEYKVLNQKLHPEVWYLLFPPKKKPRYYIWRGWNPKSYEEYVGCRDTNLDKVAKEIGQPVFLIDNVGRGCVSVYNEIPILANHGIPALISPEQMYQDIYMYMSNVMRDNPDKNPPVTEKKIA